MAKRLTGSADLYVRDGRKPYNSINFITCHDGFTLRGLFAYNEKHNEANHEDNHDGMQENYSWNCGAEGETKDKRALTLRKQMVKNALSCVLFSSGTPMILYGDEMMRTQQGNNNAYCQDNEPNWINCNNLKAYPDIFDFCARAVHSDICWFSMNHRAVVVQLPKFEGLRWYRLVYTAQSPGDDFRPYEKRRLLRRQDRHYCAGRTVNVLWVGV